MQKIIKAIKNINKRRFFCTNFKDTNLTGKVDINQETVELPYLRRVNTSIKLAGNRTTTSLK